MDAPNQSCFGLGLLSRCVLQAEQDRARNQAPPNFADPPLLKSVFRSREISLSLIFEFVESLGAPRSTRASVLQSINIPSDSIRLVEDDLRKLVHVLNR